MSKPNLASSAEWLHDALNRAAPKSEVNEVKATKITEEITHAIPSPLTPAETSPTLPIVHSLTLSRTAASSEDDSIECAPLPTPKTCATSLTLTSPKPKPGFGDLTDSLVVKIFDSLVLKSDQRALMMGNKKTYQVLVPKLYHTITVDISQFSRELRTFTNMLIKSNAGLAYVRRVVFDIENEVEKTRSPAGLQFLVTLFIEELPEDSLEYFGWPSSYDILPSTSETLWDDHRNLQNLDIYELTLQDNCLGMLDILSEMKDVRSLRVSPETERGLYDVHKILRNMGSITALHLDLGRCKLPKPSEVSTGIIDIVASSLFKHILVPAPHGRISPPLSQLTRLTLWEVDLTCSQSTWLRAISIGSVKEMELAHCEGVGHFLNALVEGATLVQSFKFEHWFPDGHIMENLERFLRKLANQSQPSLRVTLKKLSLRIKGHEMLPPPDVIANLCDDLETLHLDIFDIRRIETSPADVSDKSLDANRPDEYRTICYSRDEMISVLSNLNRERLRHLALSWTWNTDTALAPRMWQYCNPISMTFIELDFECNPKITSSPESRVRRFFEDARKQYKESELRLNVIVHNPLGYVYGPTLGVWVKAKAKVLQRTQDVLVRVEYQELRKYGYEANDLFPVYVLNNEVHALYA